jgi:hypothetical protein
MRFALTIVVTSVVVPLVLPAVASANRVCWPGVKLPSVTLPAVTLPAQHLPAQRLPPVHVAGGCVGSYCWKAYTVPGVTIPAVTIPAVSIPAMTIPGYELPRRCFDTTAAVLPPSRTTVRVRNYRAVDRQYSPQLSATFWRRAGRSVSIPDYAAPGFGEVNGAGFPKNQYVRPYIRRDGTYVSGYWRNSSTDGLPTCRITSC